VTPAAAQAGCDIRGRLWDVLQLLKRAVQARKGQPTTTVLFDISVVIDRLRPSKVQLKAVCGPDDGGRPCMTIMCAEED
jgi:hypothetical protein